MTPPMYRRVCNLIVAKKLAVDYEIQFLAWRESAGDDSKARRYMVFRPNGGGNIDRDLSSEHYVLVDVITGKNPGDYAKSEADVQAIIDYVQANPITDSCVGQITNIGGIPAPVLTTEGRMVWRLQFACLYGE